jgi:hypothetical protein
MTYYKRDSDKTIANYTSFCGTGVKTEGGDIIKSGCFTELDVSGFDVEACFCDADMCNRSNGRVGATFTAVVALFFAGFAFIQLDKSM